MRSVSFARAALPFLLSSAALVGGCRTLHGEDRRAGLGPGEPSVSPGPRVSEELPNGVRVVIEENHLAPVVAIEVWVAAGAADDPPALAGAAHLYEHLLFRGTKRRPAGAAGREIAAVEGTLGAWTGLDETVYYATVAAPFLDLGLDVLADALANPTFDAAEIDRARKLALDEIAGARVDAARRASDALFATAFAGHRYGRPVLGTAASVASLSRAALVSRFAEIYGASALTVVVVGDVAPGAFDAVARAFGSIPRGHSPAASSDRGALPVSPSHVVLTSGGASPPEIVLGFRTAELPLADVAALDLLAAVLARGETARLQREVVRNRQLAERVRPFSFRSRDGGLVAFAVTPAPHRIAQAAEATVGAALRLASEPPTEEEVAVARTAVEADLARAGEGAPARARRLGFGLTIAHQVDHAESYLDLLRTRGPADLQKVAAKVLTVEALTLAVALPEGPAGHDEAPAALGPRLEAAIAAAPAQALRQAWEPQPGGGDALRVVTPSGARVLVLRDRTAPMVAVEAVWIDRPDSDEPGANDTASLIAALLDRGTRTRSAADLAAAMRAIGGGLQGFAAPGVLGLRADFLPRDLGRGISVIADCLLHPAFPAGDLEVERRALLGRVRGGAEAGDAGSVAALRLFQETLWPDRKGSTDDVESLPGLTRVGLLDRYRRRYPLSRLIVAVVGDVDPAGTAALLGGALSTAPGSSPQAPPPSTGGERGSARQEPVTVFRPATGPEADAVVGYPTFAPGDPDRLAIEVLAEILGGQGGRLGGELGEDRSLSCRTKARAAGQAAPGYLAVALTCAPPRLDAAVATVRAAFARVVAAGVTPEEVNRAARRLIGVRAAALRTQTAVADALVRDEGSGLPLLSYRRTPAALARIGADDVARAARRALDPRREVIAVVTGTGK